MAKIEKKESKQELQKAEPRHPLSHFEEMDRMFEDFFSHGWMRPFRWEWPAVGEITKTFESKSPKVDVVERDDEVVVVAELPGVDKKDLDVSVTENSVTIKGTTRHEEKEEKGDYYRCEITRGAYARSVSLPAYIDADKAKASFKDGVLELTLPKVEKSKRRSIEIK